MQICLGEVFYNLVCLLDHGQVLAVAYENKDVLHM